jgi:hypothetical protein
MGVACQLHPLSNSIKFQKTIHMNQQKTSVYTVAEKDCNSSPYPTLNNQTIEIWAEIIKPVAKPKFLGECESKIAKFEAKLPVELQKLQLAINKEAPGYELVTWWIPESENEF